MFTKSDFTRVFPFVLTKNDRNNFATQIGIGKIINICVDIFTKIPYISEAQTNRNHMEECNENIATQTIYKTQPLLCLWYIPICCL
jgi:hypothetical protein